MLGEESDGKNMTSLQVNDITFKRSEDYSFISVVKFYNSGTQEFTTTPLDNYNFNFKLSENKFCTGYYKDGQYFECKFKNKIDENAASQCNYCERIQGFKSSFIFGDLTHERSEEILSQEYFIYLAYFEPGIIKVGTANTNRGNLRLMEQDCLIYTFIAKGTGYKIQKLEHLISRKLSITETVKSNHKFKYLHFKSNFETANNKLNSTFDRVKAEFSNSEYADLFFDSILVKNLSETNNIFYPEKYKKINDLNLFGKFKGLRGRYLLIENNSDIAAFDINYLLGRFIEDYLEDYQYNFFEEQLSLL